MKLTVVVYMNMKIPMSILNGEKMVIIIQQRDL